ncbi:diheme cytochrome c [Rhabdochromatium marinum]|uniref:diheme cytochrome c n=1 Tax=Rhabdochromatium marinum TaxID=48729 RepID=UPI0019057D29|nr:diheme cytochrome c [Rhabdochromatium marinum]MBK1650477.1 cytochrome C [Rhabdochromatium marinum]
MNKLIRHAMIVGATLIGLAAAGVAISDSDDYHKDRDHHDEEHDGWIPHRPDVAPVENPRYAEECGACHMAYQPGLLPAAAWQRILSADALIDHYGDDASLGEDTRQRLQAYLSANAADQARLVRARAFAFAVPATTADSADASAGGALPRITMTAYFQRKHDEIPPRLVVENPDVGSFSQCNKCHQDAAAGIYDEDQVSIPGFGRWED